MSYNPTNNYITNFFYPFCPCFCPPFRFPLMQPEQFLKMASEGAWLAFKRFFKISEFLYYQPWTWNEKVSRLIRRPFKQLGPWFLFTFAVFWLIFLYTLYITLTTLLSTEVDPIFHPTMALIWIIVITASGLTLAVAYTLIASGDDACWGFTQVYRFSQSVKMSVVPPAFKIPHTKLSLDLEGFLLNALLFVAIAWTGMGFVFPFALIGDPMYYFFRGYNLPKLLDKVVRGSIQLVLMTHGVFVVLNLVIPIIIYLLIIPRILKSLKQPDKEVPTMGRVKRSLVKSRGMYRQLQIFTKVSNQIICYVAPTGLLIMMILTVVLATAVVTCGGKIPHAVTVGLVFLCGACTATTNIIIKLAAIVNNDAIDILQLWKCRSVYLKTAERKELRSWAPLGMEIGPFFIITRSTAGSYLWETVDKTITLMISFSFDEARLSSFLQSY